MNYRKQESLVPPDLLQVRPASPGATQLESAHNSWIAQPVA